MQQGEPNPIEGDQASCDAFSQAVQAINDSGVSSTSSLTQDQADAFSALSRTANQVGRSGIWDGTSAGGAESEGLRTAARDLAENDAVGSAYVNDGYGDENETVVAIAAVAAALKHVVEACAGLNRPMSTAQFNFDTSSDPRPTTPEPDTLASQIPQGFTDAGTGVAYRFVPDPKCDYLKCSQLEIFAQTDCAVSVYVQANIIDDSGTIYGYTNDLLGPMRAGEHGIATLTVANKFATGVKLSEVTCR